MSAYSEDWLHETIVLANKEANTTLIGLHCWGGSPFDFHPLAQAFSKHPIRFVFPRMDDVGLAKVVTDEISINAWLSPIRTLIRKELENSDQVYLCGLSMGGTIATMMSVEFGIKRVVLLAPFFGVIAMNNLATKVANNLSMVMPRIWKYKAGCVKSREGLKRYRCPENHFHLKSFVGLQALTKVAEASVERIPKPYLWCHSPKDPIASFDLAKTHLGKDSQHLALLNTEHIVTFDYDAASVFESMENFWSLRTQD